MEKLVSKNNMTVVHLAFDANKPEGSLANPQISNTKILLDPSSSHRAERYPIPSSFDYRSNPMERDYA